MHRFLFRLKRRDREGQGLVEYALILVFVAIVTIAIVTLLGDSITQTYCTVVYELQQGSPVAKGCKAPIVKCVVANANRNTFAMEAQVIDPDSPTPANPAATINRVEFYYNDALWHNGTGDGIERTHEYCFPRGNDCGAGADTMSVTSGSTIRAVAYDNDGRSGKCSVRVP